MCRSQSIQILKYFRFYGLVFRGGFYHEIGLGNRRLQGGYGLDSGQGGIFVCGTQSTLSNLTIQIFFNGGNGTGQSRFRNIKQRYLVAALGKNVRNPITHGSRTQYCCIFHAPKIRHVR